MTQLPIAHAGHWLVNLLYVMPLVIAVGVLMTQSWREKRRSRHGGVDKPADAPPAA